MDTTFKTKPIARDAYAFTHEFACILHGSEALQPKKIMAKTVENPAIAAKPASNDYKDPTYQAPIQYTHPDYIAYKKQLDALKAKAQLVQKPTIAASSFAQQITQEPVASPYAEGKQIGKKIAATTGGQIVVFGIGHDQTAQADVQVGIADELNESGDTRQIIYLDEHPIQDGTNESYQKWNATALEDRKVGTLGETLCGYSSAENYTIFQNDNASHDIIDFCSVPLAKTLNELSRLAPSMLAFNIDINKLFRTPSYIDRDTAMAMNVKKIKAQYPEALIFINVGGNHATEICPDKPNTPHNIGPARSNLNDPMAEQLALLYGNNKVHTIRVVNHGSYLNGDCNSAPINTNTGQFDYVVTVTPQNPKQGWLGGEWEQH